MLYVTTRNDHDAFTAYRTLGEGRGPDRGLFVPFQMPRLSPEEIDSLQFKSFSQCVADVLNLFFNARLDAWDVEFCIGRYPARMVPMAKKIMVGEAWHNPDFNLARIVRNISGRIRGNDDTNGLPTNWAWITVRIAMMFGMYGELRRLGHCSDPIDIAMPSGDFAGPMSAWYAREMGLPIRNIICGCDENDAAWELLHNGSISLDPTMHIPSDLERLIAAVLGKQEALRYAYCMENGMAYVPFDPNGLGIMVSVISWQRRESIIYNLYKSSTYILDPGSAMAYGALQDHRSSLNCLIFTECSPICSADTVAAAMHISVKDLAERLNMA